MIAQSQQAGTSVQASQGGQLETDRHIMASTTGTAHARARPALPCRAVPPATRAPNRAWPGHVRVACRRRATGTQRDCMVVRWGCRLCSNLTARQAGAAAGDASERDASSLPHSPGAQQQQLLCLARVVPFMDRARTRRQVPWMLGSRFGKESGGNDENSQRVVRNQDRHGYLLEK